MHQRLPSLPNIQTDFADWYQEVIYLAKLVDHSPVKGSMVVMPYGCALWEQIQRILNEKIVRTGHQNALFPLLIPHSFLTKEADHVAGFSPELVVATHAGGKELEEPLVIRPTSETIIHYMFARWIHSWRDLPLKINQWANVVRWELRPRPFLRTTEFYWQEGHTAHATAEEAIEEVLLMVDQYVDLIENFLAIPTTVGKKTDAEKFPGAVATYTIEGMMQDGRALQMGTSHLLSQSFAHAFSMQFQDQQGALQYPFLTSWGVTTRLIGAIVMVHGDQKGLVMPPKIAPIQVVIIPIVKKGKEQLILDYAKKIQESLQAMQIRVHLDQEMTDTPGAKFYKWELAGVPLRIEVGPREVEGSQLMLSDRLGTIKELIDRDLLVPCIQEVLEKIHKQLFERAKQNCINHLYVTDAKLTEFGKKLEQDGGFYQVGWCGSSSCEQALKEFKATSRCQLSEKTSTFCFGCDQLSLNDLIVAKAY